MFRLTTFSVGPYDNNVYVLSDPKSKQALLIDAANDAPRIIKELEGLRVSHILTTHGHADHLQALKPVREQTHAQFTCHQADESMMPIKADHRVEDGVRFRFGDRRRNNLSLLLKIVIRCTDEPDLDEIRLVLELLPHKLTRVVGRHGFDDIGIFGVGFRRRVGRD